MLQPCSGRNLSWPVVTSLWRNHAWGSWGLDCWKMKWVWKGVLKPLASSSFFFHFAPFYKAIIATSHHLCLLVFGCSLCILCYKFAELCWLSIYSGQQMSQISSFPSKQKHGFLNAFTCEWDVIFGYLLIRHTRACRWRAVVRTTGSFNPMYSPNCGPDLGQVRWDSGSNVISERNYGSTNLQATEEHRPRDLEHAEWQVLGVEERA